MADISSQLQAQVNDALSQAQPISIQGAGTKQGLGRVVDVSEEQVVSTLEHTGIVSYDPVELVMTARAGTRLAEIDDALSASGQIFASDPRRFAGEATLGGTLATNQAGAARPWRGSFRDHLLGIRLINGRGEHMRFGGQVMKNVAGYDVSRMQAGAMGSLGLITELSFKVLPKPASTAGLTLEIDAKEAIAMMSRLALTPKPLNGVAWAAGKLYVRLEGAQDSVATTVKEWSSDFSFEQQAQDAADAFWLGLREHELDFFTDAKAQSQQVWKWSCSPTAEFNLPGASDEDWLIDWRGARRWLKGDYDLGELTALASSAGGKVELYSGAAINQPVSIVESAALKQIMINLKQAFDPKNIFNSGRLYEWL